MDLDVLLGDICGVDGDRRNQDISPSGLFFYCCIMMLWWYHGGIGKGVLG